MIKFIKFFILFFLVTTIQSLYAQNEYNSLVISELEFPDTVNLGSIAVLSGIVTNTGDVPILIDIDLGINFSTDFDLNNFDYLIEDYIPLNNNSIQPGETKSFSQPTYISNQRVAPNEENVIIVWPDGVVGEENNSKNTRARNFYVNEATNEDANDLNRVGNCAGIAIEHLNDKIEINGLFAAQHAIIDVVDMNHKVVFHCEDNCPTDNIIIDVAEVGFFLVNVQLFGDEYYCFDSDVIFTEDFFDYEEMLGDYTYFPQVDELIPNFNDYFPDDFDVFSGDNDFFPDNFNIFPDIDYTSGINGISGSSGGCGVIASLNNNEIKIKNSNDEGNVSVSVKDETGKIIYECNNNCGYNEIIVQIPELENHKYSVDILYIKDEKSCSSTLSVGGKLELPNFEDSLDPCSNIDLIKEPIISNITNGTTLIRIPGYSTNAALEYRQKDAPKWESYSNNFSAFVLADLEVCTTYEVRAKFVCNGEVEYSKIQSFMTEGCDDCKIDNIDLFARNILGNTAILNWDIIPGVEYELNYKEHNQNVWNKYKTSIPFAMLLNLKTCTTYDFFIEAKCRNGFVSPGDEISFETGNCKSTDMHIENQIKLQPSIAIDYIDVTFNNINKINTLQLIDASGNTLMQIEGDKLPDNYRIDLSNFPTGFYIVNVNSSEKQYSNKFIKR